MGYTYKEKASNESAVSGWRDGQGLVGRLLHDLQQLLVTERVPGPVPDDLAIGRTRLLKRLALIRTVHVAPEVAQTRRNLVAFNTLAGHADMLQLGQQRAVEQVHVLNAA